MKDLFDLLISDEEGRFTKREKVIYGIVVPVVLVIIFGIAGWMETRCA